MNWADVLLDAYLDTIVPILLSREPNASTCDAQLAKEIMALESVLEKPDE